MSDIMTINPGTERQTPIEIALQIDDEGNTTSKALYGFLELNQAVYSRWTKSNIIENPYAEAGKDYWVFNNDVENPQGGRPSVNYKLTSNFAKKLAMASGSPKGEEARDYFVQVEQSAKHFANSMRDAKVIPLSDYKGREVDAKYNNSVARLNKSLAEKAKVLKDIANDPTTPETYRQVLNAKAAEIVAEQMILPLPETEKTYTATEIGLEVGMSANKIGRIANMIGAKNDIDAVLVWDKSKSSAKQVESWRYRESGRRKIVEEALSMES